MLGPYLLLDLASALVTLVLAGGFLHVARWSRRGLHGLIANGFALFTAGFVLSAFADLAGPSGDLGGALPGATWPVLSGTAFRMAGALAFVLAYVDHHTGWRHPGAVMVASLVSAGAIAALLYLVPPEAFRFGPVFLATASSVLALSFLLCALLSGYGWHQRPTLGRSLVPLGFMAWSLSAYTSALALVAQSPGLQPVVYAWRLLALGLLLAAMLRRPGQLPRRADAPA